MVFKNRVLRRIFEPKREEMAGGWKRLHNEELHDFCASPNIIRVIMSRKMRWAGRVACMGAIKMRTKYWSEKPERQRPLGKLGFDGRIILKWILEK
jgi:hypothetical protein